MQERRMCEEEETRENFGIWNMFLFFIYFFQISPSGENERVTAGVKCKFQKEDAFVAASYSRLHRRNSTYMHRCTYTDTT